MITWWYYVQKNTICLIIVYDRTNLCGVPFAKKKNNTTKPITTIQDRHKLTKQRPRSQCHGYMSFRSETIRDTDTRAVKRVKIRQNPTLHVGYVSAIVTHEGNSLKLLKMFIINRFGKNLNRCTSETALHVSYAKQKSRRSEIILVFLGFPASSVMTLRFPQYLSNDSRF